MNLNTTDIKNISLSENEHFIISFIDSKRIETKIKYETIQNLYTGTLIEDFENNHVKHLDYNEAELVIQAVFFR